MKSLTQFVLESQQKEYVSLSEKLSLSKNKEYVDVIIYSEEMEVLVLQRANYMKNFRGMWGVVGGSIENGETPEEAALREVKEETGISKDKIERIKEIGKIRHENGSISYLFQVWTVEVPEVKLSGEHQRYKWISNTNQIKGKWMPDIKEEIDKILK